MNLVNAAIAVVVLIVLILVAVWLWPNNADGPDNDQRGIQQQTVQAASFSARHREKE